MDIPEPHTTIKTNHSDSEDISVNTLLVSTFEVPGLIKHLVVLPVAHFLLFNDFTVDYMIKKIKKHIGVKIQEL